MTHTKNRITRRDFLNGTQIAIGSALLSPWSMAFGSPEQGFSLPASHYPPQLTGLRGSHDGSWETMHARVAGQAWPLGAPEEDYDLIVVGAGISGLSSAWFYQQRYPDARILILDNHDDFGGHAKRNEFEFEGQTRITYGGTEAIDTPSSYSKAARELLSAIGVDVKRFYDYYDQSLYGSYKLSKGILFGEESFGETKLVRGYGRRDWAEFAAEMPLSDKAKQDFVRVQTEQVDYLPDLSFDEKVALLSKVSYEDFLRDYAKVDEEVIAIYKRWGMSFWCVGIDEIPTTLIQNYDGGMPGVEHTLPRTGSRGDEPYIFHFPDGNASIARLLVRALNPKAVPGSSMEDVVTAKVDYSMLDDGHKGTNIRLLSTVVAVENQQNGSVQVQYIRKGRPHTVRAKHCVLACYNSAIPHLCKELPQAQKEALQSAVKVPLVYTKVLIPNWEPFVELGLDFVYYTNGFYKQVELSYPVSMGAYRKSDKPTDPMVLHLCHVPWMPDIQGPEQWCEARRQILATPFATFEHHVYEQLNQALGSTGFNAENDVAAITVNRWPHGYAYSPDLIWEPERSRGELTPWEIGRQAIGNIHIANSDAAASADTNAAISQAYRAVNEMA